MKWRIIIILLSVSLLSLQFLANAQVQRVSDVTPTITADFNETVTITEAVFFNKDLLEFINAEYDSEDQQVYYFTPEYALSNGEYDLVIVAEDILGNSPDQPYRFSFEVFLPEPLVEMILPNAIGVANSTTFDIVVRTLATASATCKYKGSLIGDYNQPGLQVFEGAGTNTHTIYNYSVPVDNPRPLFVICEDDLTRRFGKAFMIYSDLTPPVMVGVSYDPDPVVEYPLFGDIRTIMQAKGNEPVLCKYTRDPDQKYSFMTPFDAYNKSDFDAFVPSNFVTLTFPINTTRETFEYYVQCEDRAGWRTEKQTTSVLVDLTFNLQLNVVTPSPASRETAIVLNITTNKLAYCRYRPADGAYTDMSSNPTNIQRSHTVNLGTFGTGSYMYDLYCFSDQSGEPEEVQQSYTFTVDTLPPSITVINTSALACGNQVSAVASATDEHSGIEEYIWMFKVGAEVIANGTSSDGGIDRLIL